MAKTSDPDAVIDSVVHGSQAVLSFRELSALLSVPLHVAQGHLTGYVARRSKKKPAPNVLWHVTTAAGLDGVIRTSLTSTPPLTAVAKKVWAVAPPASARSSDLWLQPDRNRDLALVSEPTHQPNSLRDGRFLPVVSPTCDWDARPDPRFGAVAAPALSNKRKASSLLQSVKQPIKRGAQAKTAKATKPSFKPNAARTNGPSSSLFSKKRLGQAAAARMKGKGKEGNTSSDGRATSQDSRGVTQSTKSLSLPKANRKKNAKSTRHVMNVDSPHEAEDDKMKASRPDAGKLNLIDDDDDDDSIEEMEHRAMEKERTDEDRAEVERELRDLCNDDDNDEPQSPELQDVDKDGEEKKEVDAEAASNADNPTSPSQSGPDGSKRSFRETFGLPQDGRGARRIRKEVHEVVEENGYMLTKVVIKTFDEHGNEVNCEDPANKESNLATSNHKNEASAARQSDADMPSKSKNGLFKGFNGKPSAKKDAAKKEKAGSVPSKKTSKKKVKGNIMSYFGKKN